MFLNKAFYFIRHGKIDWNLNNTSTSRTEIPLSESGILQAQSATSLLENINLTRIISSPLLRARQTAEILSSSLGLPLAFDEGLKEINTSRPQTQHENISYNKTLIRTESETDFQNRIILTVNNILKSEELPLIVSHGDVFSILSRILLHANICPDNCIPYFFNPPSQINPHWLISILAK